MASTNKRLARALHERDVPHVRDHRPVRDDLDIKCCENPPPKFFQPVSRKGGHPDGVGSVSDPKSRRGRHTTADSVVIDIDYYRLRFIQIVGVGGVSDTEV